MRLTKRQERLAETTGHWPDVYKRNIGSTPTYPARPIYAAARLAIEEYLRDRGEIW